MMSTDQSYAVHVVFFERGYWSKAYTYKSDIAYAIGDIVIVPTNDFYSVGKVTGSEKGYKFKSDIKYKSIIQKVSI